MPAKWFKCPDNQETPIAACLEQCRMGSRCMTLPTLRLIADERPPNNPPKVTASQAGNGARLIYLTRTKNFTIDPQGRAFALLGTSSHAKLEGKTAGEMLAEVDLHNEYTSTRIDLYEPYTLTDYKTWGAYKIRKALGFVQREVVDPTGALYTRKVTRKDGRVFEKGDPKMITIWVVDPRCADMWEADLQVNMQRILLEEAGFRVDHMQIEAIVKEPPHARKRQGIDRQIYLFPVQKLDDEYVRNHYREKTMALRHALETGEVPDYCTIAERWDNRRCEEYCDVAHICQPHFAQVQPPEEQAEEAA